MSNDLGVSAQTLLAVEDFPKARISKFIPVDKTNLAEAVKIARRALPNQQDKETATSDLYASVYTRVYEKRYSADLYGPLNLRYFLVCDETGHAFGFCGMFETIADLYSASWMGWLCVQPEFQNNGIGAAMIQFCIDQARIKGADFLRVETSNQSMMARTNRILQRMQFAQFDLTPSTKQSTETISLYLQHELLR